MFIKDISFLSFEYFLGKTIIVVRVQSCSGGVNFNFLILLQIHLLQRRQITLSNARNRQIAENEA